MKIFIIMSCKHFYLRILASFPCFSKSCCDWLHLLSFGFQFLVPYLNSGKADFRSIISKTLEDVFRSDKRGEVSFAIVKQVRTPAQPLGQCFLKTQYNKVIWAMPTQRDTLLPSRHGRARLPKVLAN